MTNHIQYFNREKNIFETEIVYGEKSLRWLYNSRLGKILNRPLTSHLVSILYGKYQDSLISRRKIRPFIKKFEINIQEFEQGYSSFNDFFSRKFLPQKRFFIQTPSKMPAFAEARYLGFENADQQGRISIKGAFISPNEIIQKFSQRTSFKEGPILIARLCPVDYHRFHFFDNGQFLDQARLTGRLNSVNPLALAQKPKVFFENERIVSILQTQNFGKIAYIEIGATCVGKIVQTHQKKEFQRGKEKGYFLFGGSTVIVIGEKKAWKPSSDIIKNSHKGIETFIQLGDEVAIL